MLAGVAFVNLATKPPRQIARMPRLPKSVHIHLACSLVPRDRQDWDA
jgi:hypothetical protein